MTRRVFVHASPDTATTPRSTPLWMRVFGGLESLGMLAGGLTSPTVRETPDV